MGGSSIGPLRLNSECLPSAYWILLQGIWWQRLAGGLKNDNIGFAYGLLSTVILFDDFGSLRSKNMFRIFISRPRRQLSAVLEALTKSASSLDLVL